MRTLFTWIVILAILGGLGWWQREKVVPYVATNFPQTKPYIAMVPELAALAAPKPAEGGDGKAARQSAPVSVVLAKTQTKTLPVVIDAVGTVQATASIPVRARIDNAEIVSIDVAEGAKVEQGAKLFTLDDRTLRAQLAQIDATIAKDNAQIEQNQLDLNRADDLLSRKAGSAVTRDTAATALKVGQAQLAADKATRDATSTTLGYTVIKAPVAGRVGSIPVKVGSVVRLSDATPLATVNQIDPAVVVFSLPQTRLMELRDAMARGPVKIEVASGSHKLSGTVDFIENTIDTTTGTVAVNANVPNAEELLWPGAFVTVKVILDSTSPSVVVSSNAVQLGQSGSYVFVVEDKTAKMRPVTVSRSAGAEVIITTGLKDGEQVVVDGQLRLVDGATVVVKSAAAGDQASLEPQANG